MSILAFLTASRFKTELTRQRDEIARLHQMLDMEVAQKQEAEKQFADQQQQIQTLTEKRQQFKTQLADRDAQAQIERKKLKDQLATERDKTQAKADGKLHEMNIRLSTLGQELDERQNQRAEVTEQNAKLAERAGQLNERLNEMAASLQQGEERIKDLEEEKIQLEVDLQKIMGNLTRW